MSYTHLGILKKNDKKHQYCFDSLTHGSSFIGVKINHGSLSDELRYFLISKKKLRFFHMLEKMFDCIKLVYFREILIVSKGKKSQPTSY